MKLPEFKDKLNKTLDHLLDDFATIRGNRAQASLVEGIKVDAYPGSAPLTVRELGSITIPDAQLIIVEVWDGSIAPILAKAIFSSGTGLNPVVDGKTIKIPVPALTGEKRKELAKIVLQKVEEAKVSVRNIRRDALSALEEQKENSVVSEDEHFTLKEQYEKEVREINLKISEKGKEKEQELLHI
jgi:ribosome recycling factor